MQELLEFLLFDEFHGAGFSEGFGIPCKEGACDHQASGGFQLLYFFVECSNLLGSYIFGYPVKADKQGLLFCIPPLTCILFRGDYLAALGGHVQIGNNKVHCPYNPAANFLELLVIRGQIVLHPVIFPQILELA